MRQIWPALLATAFLAAGMARAEDPPPPRPAPANSLPDSRSCKLRTRSRTRCRLTSGPDPAALALFAKPAIAETLQAAVTAAQAGDLGTAAATLDDLLARHPEAGEVLATRAAIAMLAGDAPARP